MNPRIEQATAQLIACANRLRDEQSAEFEQLAKRLAQLFADGGQLLTAGSGLFQFVAQMIATQFTYRLDFERPALPSICLGSDVVLSAAIAAAGDYEQLMLRHYRALANDYQLLLMLGDGQPNPALLRLRDELLEQGQTVALVSGTGSDDPLFCDEINFCLHTGGSSKARQLETMQFAGHLLCELVEAELFQR